ncbi:MAG TPA: hypothetical protein VK760_14795 [Candidatus Acidoferrales bacterium]|jgi:hypothetical protein|nr:hypothetical protein [Candidatus Acidoferrales bacterium]
MTPPDQIKAIAADFLRALATVPELFTRWQAEASPAGRADIVRTQLGLTQPLSVADVARMAAHTAPHALATAQAAPLFDVPMIIVVVPPVLASASAA